MLKLVKTTINTAITVKLLKSKVTLNTCEKLKMTRETQLDLWEYEVKGQCSCYCVPECVNMSQLG